MISNWVQFVEEATFLLMFFLWKAWVSFDYRRDFKKTSQKIVFSLPKKSGNFGNFGKWKGYFGLTDPKISEINGTRNELIRSWRNVFRQR